MLLHPKDNYEFSRVCHLQNPQLSRQRAPQNILMRKDSQKTQEWPQARTIGFQSGGGEVLGRELTFFVGHSTIFLPTFFIQSFSVQKVPLEFLSKISTIKYNPTLLSFAFLLKDPDTCKENFRILIYAYDKISRIRFISNYRGLGPDMDPSLNSMDPSVTRYLDQYS